VRATLAQQERQPHTRRSAAADALAVMREAFADWQAMLRQEAPHARQALAALVTGRLVFAPRAEGPDRYYEFARPGSFDEVIAALTLPIELVPPG